MHVYAEWIVVELYPLWKNRNILLTIKIRVFNGNVKCETWEVTTKINKLQTFDNRCLRRILGLKWRKIISYTELWEGTGEEPVIIQIRMRKWRWIGHTLKGMNALKSRYRTEIRMEPELKGDRSRPMKRPFWRKRENAPKHGTRLRGPRATGFRWRSFKNAVCS